MALSGRTRRGHDENFWVIKDSLVTRTVSAADRGPRSVLRGGFAAPRHACKSARRRRIWPTSRSATPANKGQPRHADVREPLVLARDRSAVMPARAETRAT